MTLRHEGRVAARALLKRPTFAVVATLSLGLAIALNTTMYSVIDALLNPVLDVRRPEQMYRLFYWHNTRRGRLDPLAIETALRSSGVSYEAISGYNSVGHRLFVEFGNHVAPADGIVVRHDFLSIFGARPRSGRIFSAADLNDPTASVVISDRLATRLFPTGREAVGTVVQIDGQGYDVIGVLTRSLGIYGLDGDVWLLPDPAAAPPPINMLRVRDGVDPKRVNLELAVLARQLAAAAGESSRDTRFQISSWIIPQFHGGRFYYALIAAVFAVLLVACANLANLQLARGMARGRELAVRAALGASRAQLMRPLLAETALVAGAGLVVGIVLTLWGVHALSASIPTAIADYIIEPRVSWRVLVFAGGAALACLTLVGVLPALRVSRVDPNELLKSGAGTGAHRQSRRAYGWMIVGQIALALALLSGATVLVRSAWRSGQPEYLIHGVYGFDPTPLVGVALWMPEPPGRATDIAGPVAELLSRLRSTPDVMDAAVDWSAAVVRHQITVDAGTGVREVQAPMWTYEIVSPSYFTTMNVPIIKGRGFAESELDARSVVLDNTTAAFLWPGADPVGHIVKFGGFHSAEPWNRVVGVVGSMRDEARYGPDPLHLLPGLWKAYRVLNRRDSSVAERNGLFLQAIVRTRHDPARVAVALRHALANAGAARQPAVETMDERYRISWRHTRNEFVASLFAMFAAVGLGLAAIGIYGIVAHSVTQRRREIGVRIALGATSRQVVGALLREGNVLALAGVAAGLLCTKQTVGWVAMFLNENDLYDEVLFAMTAAVLFAVVVIAALVPAARATRIDPTEALRSE